MKILRTFRAIHCIVIIIGALLWGLPSKSAHADAANKVVIFAIQTASSNSAGDEVIVLMNTGEDTVSLLDWEIQYQSTAGTSWSTKAKLMGMAKPRSLYVVATAGNWPGEVHDSLIAGMAGGGGHIRVRQPLQASNEYVDLVGYGTALHALVQPAQSPPAGQFIVRKLDADDMPINSGDNSQDFILTHIIPEITMPEVEDPVATTIPTEQPTEDDLTDNDPGISPTPSSISEGQEEVQHANPTPTIIPEPLPTFSPNHLLVISELLPNPALPDLDSEAEYIEIYNDSDMQYVLDGCMLHSGANLSYSAALQGTVGAQSYKVLYAADYRMALGNTSGKVEIRCSDTIVTTVQYSGADEGNAWAKIGNVWQWTLRPTPGADNVLVQAVGPEQASALKPSVTPKPTKPKATPTPPKPKSSPTPKSTKGASKTSTKSDSKVNSGGQEVYEEPTASAGKNTALLAAVGGIAILYALYEYRYDIANRYTRCRRYVSAWRANRRSITRR